MISESTQNPQSSQPELSRSSAIDGVIAPSAKQDKPVVEQPPTVGWQPAEAIVQFMLSERQAIADRWTHADQLAEGRLNSYITITSGATGVLLLLSQLKVTNQDFLAVGLIVFTFIWLLGLITFSRMLERNFVVVGYIRAINRTRHFFVDLDSQVEHYLALPVTDSAPKYTNLGARKFGARTISAVISSLALGLFGGSIYTLAITASQVSNPSVIIGAITFIIHLVILETYATVRLRDAEKNYEIRFPPKKKNG